LAKLAHCPRRRGLKVKVEKRQVADAFKDADTHALRGKPTCRTQECRVHGRSAKAARDGKYVHDGRNSKASTRAVVARVWPKYPPALDSAGHERTFCEDLFGGKQAIECGGESGIDRHLHDDFHDFVLGATHVECAMNVYFYLRRGVAQRS